MNTHLDPAAHAHSGSPAPSVVALAERHRGRLRDQSPDLGKQLGRLEFALVHSGSGTLHTDAGPLPLGPGHVVLVPPGKRYRIEDSSGNPLGLYLLVVPHEVLLRSKLNTPALPHGRIELDPAGVSFVGDLFRRLFFEQSRDNAATASRTESLSVSLLAALPELVKGNCAVLTRESENLLPSAGMERVRQYLGNVELRFFTETTIDRAADSLRLSRRRFTQLFRELTDTTWLAYVRRLRIAHARQLLQGTRRTVNSVAFECGFDDLSTFYRAFKREVSTSPNRWRQEREGL
ncbi:MAG: AraC-like DNA-binding protein [Planctomycetota bacterium]|jgi:AraC-like DNA-binding protein